MLDRRGVSRDDGRPDVLVSETIGGIPQQLADHLRVLASTIGMVIDQSQPRSQRCIDPCIGDVGGLDAEEVQFDDEFDLDAADSDDDELDEDQPTEFVWQGTTYWRTWDGHVMDDPDGAVVGRWDDESESVVFDE